MKHLRVSTLAVVLLALATLTACGSDDSGDSGTAATSPSSSASAPAGAEGGGPGGGDPTQLAAIQQCLEAAGLGDAMPSGGPGGGGTPPSGMPTDMPSGMPTDMPSGMPTDMPSGMPTDGSLPGGGGAFQDPAVQAALTACGITMPSSGAAPSGAPS